MTAFVHLRAGGTSVVLECSAGPPSIVHWGSDLGDDAQLDPMAFERAVPRATLDGEAPIAIVPEHGSGFAGRPGLAGHRADGSAWSPRFVTDEPVSIDGNDADLTWVGDVVDKVTRFVCRDDIAGLELMIDVALAPAGVLVARSTVTNVGATSFTVDALAPTLPVPGHARELLTFSGRWCAEFQTTRRDWVSGAHTIENRRGRTSHDHTPALIAGTPGFTETAGEVWGVHLGWSANHVLLAEELVDGRRYIQAGELLLPGEIELAPGESYASPFVFGSFSDVGLNGMSSGFHEFLRSRPEHPGPARQRPVLLNTWEAVYFDHDQTKLRALADRAAEIGVERFVLDDGWFGSRRDDTTGLGDWWVDRGQYPEGLGPLIGHVTGLGMEFGLWVEPEMVNPDSDLYRAHPDWALIDHAYEPILARQQLVLDLANPDAFADILGKLDRILSEHPDISYLKWDMNRDHVQATHEGRAGSHAQMDAVYRLIDELRTRHPGVEIESCSSGGGRADFEVLARTDRIWTSDSNDAVDRHSIQRGFSLLFPPELMGAHVGPTRSHTTGRRNDLHFRAVTALFGHFGVEWNLLEATEDDRAQLAAVIATHKRLRPMLHSGTVVRLDHPDPAAIAHGVIALDHSEAVFAVAQISSPSTSVPPPLRPVGLDPARRYRVRLIDLPGAGFGHMFSEPGWLADDGVELTGRQLMAHGLPLPVLHPESAILVQMVAAD